jgi:hypothetical protein
MSVISEAEGDGMFLLEAEMAKSAARWFETAGMVVKSEFITPWGVCDFVGVKFNLERVNCRLKLRQTKAVSSIIRAVLLLQIPDVKTRKSVSIDWLIRDCAPSIPAEIVESETARLIADRFVVSTARGRLQKSNGWMPLQDRLVALELKLSRIEEVMHQAMNNLGFAEESYVGLPATLAQRVAANPSRWSAFFDAGIGLLSVSRHHCEVLVQPHKAVGWTDAAIQLYCVEKFWRTRARGN